MNRRDVLAGLALGALSPLLPLRAAEGPVGRILYTRKEGERYLLHVMNADGTEDRALPGQTANVNVFPAVSPDGKRIVFMAGDNPAGDDFHLVRCNADGSEHKKLPIEAKFAGVPAWSPDGKQLAYIASDGAEGVDFSVFVCDASGANPRRLNPAGKVAMFPFWSHDGKGVGYTTATNGQEEQSTELVLITLEGGQIAPLVQLDRPAYASAHGLSPDGKQLLFNQLDEDGKTVTIKSLVLGDKVERTLFNIAIGEGESLGPVGYPVPSWAADGKTFMVSMSTEKGVALYRCSADGQQRTRITPENAYCSGGVWIPAAQ